MNSVLMQTFPNFVLRVYDDASGDETRSVDGELAQHDRRVCYVVREKNIGARANFIRAMAGITTPLTTVLDDDDVLFPEFLQAGLQTLTRHPEARLYCGVLLFCNEAGQCVNVPAEATCKGIHQPPGPTRMMCSQTLDCVLFHAELTALTQFDQDITAYDTHFLWQAAARWPVVVDETIAGIHFVYDGTVSDLLKPEVSLLGLRRMSQVTARMAAEYAPGIAVQLDEVIRMAYARMILQAIGAGEFTTAAKSAKILGSEMGQRLLGCSLGFLAKVPALRQLFRFLLRTARGRQSSSRRRRYEHYDPLVKDLLAALG
jgi:hypothetical protein